MTSMMNNTDTGARSDLADRDAAFAFATIHEFHRPDIAPRQREAFVRREYSPLLTPEHIDVTHRPVRYAKPKTFVFPSRRQLRNMTADRWMRQRFKAAKTASYNELPSVDYTIDNRAVLAPSSRLGRNAIESILLALSNASRYLRFNKKIVH
jgi:hypothetical protein